MALDLGPCRVYFGDADSEEDLGKTQGGVRLSFSQSVADLSSDQYGTEPEDQVITGQGATITCPLANYTLDSIALALNQTKKSLGSQEGIKGSSLVGTKLSSKAKSLLLKKYVDGEISSDKKDWIRFPKAAPIGTFELTYDGETQRVIETIFRAFPDDNEVLYYFGDEEAAESGS
ncbi:MAG: hypothetical protein J7J52_04595 [Deltaproteobacteria bacterium]|nr:hypothetical protein [Deltaproteobacteria bacterium]